MVPNIITAFKNYQTFHRGHIYEENGNISHARKPSLNGTQRRLNLRQLCDVVNEILINRSTIASSDINLVRRSFKNLVMKVNGKPRTFGEIIWFYIYLGPLYVKKANDLIKQLEAAARASERNGVEAVVIAKK